MSERLDRSGCGRSTGMERHREGGGTQGVRGFLAEGRICRSGGVSVRKRGLKFLLIPLTSFRMNLQALGNTNRIRTFYGTQCICDLGVADSSLCSWKSCGICSTIKNSFTTLEFGATSNNGRYGKGIYSYFDPSMADRFATSSASSPYRAILACEVNVPATDSNASKSPMVVKSVSTQVPCIDLKRAHLDVSFSSSKTKTACSFLLRRPLCQSL